MRTTALLVLHAALLAPIAAGATSEDDLRALPAAEFTRDHAAHLLRRAAFGGTPAEIDALHARGLEGAVAWLVDYQDRPAPAAFTPTTTTSPRQARMEARAEMGMDMADGALDREDAQRVQREYRQRDQAQMLALRSWWLSAMVASPRPLEERMTLFWHGHFCSSQRDVRNSYHLFLQHQFLRENATGSFRTLVEGIARDPAMLEYLDNRTSRKEHPNENFARELLELFTLGVGHYSETDIQEAARAFTGWTFVDNAYVFNRRWHDNGVKTFLGRTGNLTGDDIIATIFTRPECAEFIAAKLWRAFAGTEASERIVRGLAGTLRDNDYEIAPVLRQIFNSRAFYAPQVRGARIKSPIELIVSTLRAAGATDAPLAGLLTAAAGELGESLFDPPNVKGWSGGRDWITTSTLLGRYNLAAALLASPEDLRRLARDRGGRQIAGVSTEGMDAEALTEAGLEPGMTEGEPGMESMAGESMADGSPRDEARARLLAARAARELARVGYDPMSLIAGLRTPEGIVAALLSRFLAVPAPEELRRQLIEHLEGGPIDRERLHGVLELLVSTPEFQLS